MKVIIAGSRSLLGIDLVEEAVAASGFAITEVVSGKCPKGIDVSGEDWAFIHQIPVKPFPADWKKHGRYRAGFIRNHEMGDYAEAAIVIWDKKSNGSADMIDYMKRLGKPVYVMEVDQ
jgi:hypothetical protein